MASAVTTGLSWSRYRNQMKPAISKRSEEHTSELQSLTNLVCRLLLEKKKKKNNTKKKQKKKKNKNRKKKQKSELEMINKERHNTNTHQHQQTYTKNQQYTQQRSSTYV